MDILIIKPEYGMQILTGKKKWEIRGTNALKRGRIKIAFSGTGMVYGEVDLVDSIELTEELWNANKNKHRCDFSWYVVGYKKPHAWVVKHPRLYKQPKPYVHPYGAIVWCKE